MILSVMPKSAGSLSTQTDTSFCGLSGSTATTELFSLVVKPPMFPNRDEMFCGAAVAVAAGIVASSVRDSSPSKSKKQ